MILRIFTLTLEPDNPVQFSLEELRAYLTLKLNEYTAARKNNSSGYIHRYPAVQCKMIKNSLMVIGVSQGADMLRHISDGRDTIFFGKNACSITGSDSVIRLEQFGISGGGIIYEFLTPWLGLNQQNIKRFYDLNGKTQRDLFIQKVLAGSLVTLAKSLDYKIPAPVFCDQKLKFRKDWIDNKSVMVFTGRFETNLRIPDFLGIGHSVSLGFGTVRYTSDNFSIKENEETMV